MHSTLYNTQYIDSQNVTTKIIEKHFRGNNDKLLTCSGDTMVELLELGVVTITIFWELAAAGEEDNL